jgi:DHA1 family bicyclomycin/chloramphenicol resistance-like MFS transporter
MLKPTHAAVTALLTALVALGPISTDLYLPSLPALTAYFGVGEAAGQLTLSAFLLGLAGGQIIYGPLSDRYGRRPVLLFGIGLYAAASVACVFAPSIELLVIARFCQACGACVGPVLGRAVVRDVYGREGAARILSYLSAAIALAPAIGPIIGGFVETWFGWRANFVVLALYGATALALTFTMLQETNTHCETGQFSPGRIFTGYLSFLGERTYFGYVFTCALSYCGIFAFISASSFILVDAAGLSPGLYGFCFAAVVVGYIAGTLTSGRLSAKLGINRLIAIGSVVGFTGAALVLMLALMNPSRTGIPAAIAVVGPMMLFLAGVGLTMPNAIAGAIGPFPRAAGAASALLGFLQMAMAAVVGALVGHFHNGTAIPMGVALVAVTLGIFVSFYGLVRPFGKPMAD